LANSIIMTELRRNLGTMEAVGLSPRIIARTMATGRITFVEVE